MHKIQDQQSDEDKARPGADAEGGAGVRPGEVEGPGAGGPGEQPQAGRAGGCGAGDGEAAALQGGEEDPGEEGHGEEEGEQGEGGAADQGEAGGHTGETEEGENSVTLSISMTCFTCLTKLSHNVLRWTVCSGTGRNLWRDRDGWRPR